jgi:hypothetical protein
MALNPSPAPAPIEQRLAAVAGAPRRARPDRGRRGRRAGAPRPGGVAAEDGARVVARAWVDPAFRTRLLADGRAAVAELGLSMPRHHRHLVVLENTATVQNVICCTLCSCTAFTIVGLPPDGTRSSNTAPAWCASRARCCARWPRSPAGGRDPRLGHDGGHALHGAARAAGRHRRLVRGPTRRARQPRLDDRRARLPAVAG